VRLSRLGGPGSGGDEARGELLVDEREQGSLRLDPGSPQQLEQLRAGESLLLRDLENRLGRHQVVRIRT